MEYKKLRFRVIKKSDKGILSCMNVHYSQPKGFVGRSICAEIIVDNITYGYIVGGSATRFLPGRDEFIYSLGVTEFKLEEDIRNHG